MPSDRRGRPRSCRRRACARFRGHGASGRHRPRSRRRSLSEAMRSVQPARVSARHRRPVASRSGAGRCRAGPWYRSCPAARPASRSSSRSQTEWSTARKNSTTRGTGVFSSSMPFHSWPVVKRSSDGIALPGCHRLSLPAGRLYLECFSWRDRSAFGSKARGRRSERRSISAMQIEEPPAFREADERFVVDRHRFIPSTKPSAGVRRP